MKIFPSLDSRDRTALVVCLSLVVVIVVLIAVLAPQQQDDSPIPSSYGAGTHGAKAAYLTLLRSGYSLERWERPLAELPTQSTTPTDPHIVLILAEPFLLDSGQSKKAIKDFLNNGGTVLATGATGSFLLPDGEARANSSEIASTVCHARPDGFDPIASSGEVDIESPVVWKDVQPQQRVQYRCGSGAVVFTSAYGKGQIIWWASSTPLENASILRGGNLNLLLNSLNPSLLAPAQTHILWDESLHGDIRSLSSYTAGTPVRLMWLQAGITGLLLIFSMSRRSGPLRPFIDKSRSTPVEFVESLGSLYDRAGASNTAVVIALERFRHQLERRAGFPAAETNSPAPQLAATIQARLRYKHPQLSADLAAAEAAAYSNLTPRQALSLVRSLHDHSERLGITAAATATPQGSLVSTAPLQGRS